MPQRLYRTYPQWPRCDFYGRSQRESRNLLVGVGYPDNCFRQNVFLAHLQVLTSTSKAGRPLVQSSCQKAERLRIRIDRISLSIENDLFIFLADP